LLHRAEASTTPLARHVHRLKVGFQDRDPDLLVRGLVETVVHLALKFERLDELVQLVDSANERLLLGRVAELHYNVPFSSVGMMRASRAIAPDAVTSNGLTSSSAISGWVAAKRLIVTTALAAAATSTAGRPRTPRSNAAPRRRVSICSAVSRLTG